MMTGKRLTFNVIKVEDLLKILTEILKSVVQSVSNIRKLEKYKIVNATSMNSKYMAIKHPQIFKYDQGFKQIGTNPNTHKHSP